MVKNFSKSGDVPSSFSASLEGDAPTLPKVSALETRRKAWDEVEARLLPSQKRQQLTIGDWLGLQRNDECSVRACSRQQLPFWMTVACKSDDPKGRPFHQIDYYHEDLATALRTILWAYYAQWATLQLSNCCAKMVAWLQLV